MAISLVYFPAKLNLTSDDLMVWFGLNESAPAPIVVVVAEKVVLVLHTEQRVERERVEKQSSSGGCWVSANRGEGQSSAALLQSKIGFRETTSGRVVPAGDVAQQLLGRILRVKLAHKLRNKCRIKNCDKNRSQLNGHCSER